MEHVEALGALVAGEHVAHGVVARMPDMDAAGGIGEHLKHVALRRFGGVGGGVDVRIRPDLLPVFFALGRVVAFACHLSAIGSRKVRGANWLVRGCLAGSAVSVYSA